MIVMDEVQTGLGRLGGHWWGHMDLGVVPDMVTSSKPLGNGYPIAMLALSKKVAEATLSTEDIRKVGRYIP